MHHSAQLCHMCVTIGVIGLAAKHSDRVSRQTGKHAINAVVESGWQAKACKDLVSPTMTTDGSKSSLFHECLGLTSCLIQEYGIKEYKPWSGNPLDIFQGLFASSIVDEIMERPSISIFHHYMKMRINFKV